MREIITGLDIGTDTIKLIVAEYFEDDLNILCAVSTPAIGFEDYTIVSESELIKSIKKVINKANEKLNFKIKNVIVNVPTLENNFIISDATIPVTGDDEVIGSKDILKVIQSTTHNKININDELIAAIPIYFKVGDGETNQPYKKRGKTISTKTVLVTSDKKEVCNILNIVNKCGLKVIDIVSTGLVDYYNFKNEYYDNLTGVIVNLGHSKTQVSVLSKGIYVNNEVLPVGGDNINKDISFIYRLNDKDSSYLKDNLALANIRRADPKETKELVDKDGETLVINQYELTEIVSSRITEILKLVKKSINHLTKKKISYIIVTGGLTELEDFNLILTSLFGDTAKVGTINNLGARNNKYSVCIGMIKSFKEKLKLRHREYSTVSVEDAHLMCTADSTRAGDSILGKVFGYFFDN